MTSPTLDELVTQLQTLLTEGEPEASRRVLERHPELLSDQVDWLLEQLIQASESRNDPHAREGLVRLRSLLRRCREVGVAEAFEELPEVGSQVAAQLQSLLEQISRLTEAEDMLQRVRVCQQALSLVRRRQDERLWATLQAELGNSLVGMPQWPQLKNLAMAVGCYQQALEVFERQAMPSEKAQTLINLAQVYSRMGKVHDALRCCREIQTAIGRHALLAHWAESVNKLAANCQQGIWAAGASDLERPAPLEETLGESPEGSGTELEEPFEGAGSGAGDAGNGGDEGGGWLSDDGPSGDRDATLIRYTDISCPRRVPLETARFSVVVRLITQRPKYSARVEETVLSSGKPVFVHIDAPAFEILGDRQQETAVLANKGSPPVVFDLRPSKAGHTQITFDFFQEGSPVGTVTVPIECGGNEVFEERPRLSGLAVRLPALVAPPDMILHIAWQQTSSTLQFTLIREGGTWWRSFPPTPIIGNVQIYVARLYAELTTLTTRHDPASSRHRGQTKMVDADEIERHVRSIGHNLWRDLLPRELQEIYTQERETWRNRSLLILSDEPYLPWELLWPYQPGEWSDDGPWCDTLRLTRWLRMDGRNNGNAGPPLGLRLQSLAILAPPDSDLPGAQRERCLLSQLAKQHGVADVSPAVASRQAVMSLLERGGYDNLHVAAHGNFYAESSATDSVLWLEGGTALSADSIVGPEVEGYIYKQRPGFVFNACEVGRSGWGLTRLAGWAQRLLGAGAGMFVAPLWEVSDDGALAFMEVFYGRLLAGETLGLAVQQARTAAKRAGDPTWLAYTVYGHPNARVTQGDTPAAT